MWIFYSTKSELFNANNVYGKKKERKTFNKFQEANRLLERKQFFNLLEDESISGFF